MWLLMGDVGTGCQQPRWDGLTPWCFCIVEKPVPLQLGTHYCLQLKSHGEAPGSGGRVLLHVSTQLQQQWCWILLSEALCMRHSPQDAASAE